MAAEPQQSLDALLTATDAAVVGSYSAVLYGSVARGSYVPGYSDLNVMLVLDHVTPEILRGLGRAFSAWRKAGHQPPLFMTREEWQRAADVFPIEVTDMQSAYRVLRGADPLGSLFVLPADLRRALEHEFRGKLMRLRRGYAMEHGDRRALGALAAESVSSILLLLRAMLSLTRQGVPNDALAMIASAARVAGFDPAALAEIAEHRGERGWRCSPETFVGYLAAVEAAGRHVDQLELGERP